MTDESEEIFRRAAESYPLKTGNADWEAVLKKMQNSDDDGAAGEMLEVAKKRNYRKWFLLLLLLIPFGVIEYKYASFSKVFSKKKEQQSAPVITASTKTYTDKTDSQTTTPQNKSTNDHKKVAGAVDIDQPATSTQKPGEIPVPTGTLAVAKPKNNSISSFTTIVSKKNTGTFTYAVDNNNNDNAKHTVLQKGKRKINNTNSDAESDESEKAKTAHPKLSYSSKQKTKVNIKNAPPTADEDDHKIVSTENTTVPVVEPVEEKIVAADSNVMVKKEDPVEKKSIPDTAKAVEKVDVVKRVDKEEKKKKANQKHFYAGLEIGPDFSTVKLQSVKRTGLSYGLIVGYQLNKKFSIETGFLFDKKLYSSKGKYFSTKNIPLYPNSTIDYVTGQCKMYEIPLNVRYTFSEKKKSSWFGVAGISSYLMNKEKYDYNVMYFGTSYPYSKDYKSHDNQFAAVINLSLGYTHALGKIGNLRVEPYLKLPVSKVGSGELPIQSGGIMIGITRNLF